VKISIPPGSMERKPSSPAEDIQRCTALCAGFGKHKRTAGKIERRQILPARQFCSRRPPVQPASNHQVQHQPEVAIHADGDSLADSPQFAHDAALHIGNWRLYGSKQKSARESNSLDRLADDAWFEGADVGGDIRQFWHAYMSLQVAPALLQPRSFEVNIPTLLFDPCTSPEPITGDEPDHRGSDEDLISRIISRDEIALRDAYDRYGSLVYSVAKRILQDTGAVEEVRQDTFYQLWRVAASFDSARGSLGNWLLVIARNLSIDRLRRRTPAMGEEIAWVLLGPAPDIESLVARNEMAGRIRAALRSLPEAQRATMELAYFEGLTRTEIAKRRGEPLGTVKTRLRAALISLKGHFGE
jgi:RNA polymerase sigma-70 factor (ECF subfamily)